MTRCLETRTIRTSKAVCAGGKRRIALAALLAGALACPPQALLARIADPESGEGRSPPPLAAPELQFPAPAAPRPNPQDPTAPAFLAPAPSSPDAVETVRLTPRPVAILRGEGLWNDGPTALRDAFEALSRAAADAGAAIVGHPFAVFVETDDDGYRFEAMLPVRRAVAGDEAQTPFGVRLGESPGGWALRFVHRGSFETIDDTYDAIASHLDAEGFEPQEMFIEEYVGGFPGQAGPNLAVHIYVFLK